MSTAADLDVEKIIEAISNGKTYREIAEEEGCSISTVHKALNSDEWRERSARARENSAEAWLDRGLDVLEKALQKGGETDATAARAYAQECARRAAIRNPKYRDKQQLEHSGPDGGPIQQEVKQVEWTVRDPAAPGT